MAESPSEPDITVCPTCGKSVWDESISSYSLIFWDGKGNVLVQMFCEDHPPQNGHSEDSNE